MSAGEARLVVPADHPALAGHFPGRPIVPGVLLLDAVMQAIAAHTGSAPHRLLRAKFMAPVGPGAEVTIQLTPREGGAMGFACHSGGRVVLRGEFG